MAVRRGRERFFVRAGSRPVLAPVFACLTFDIPVVWLWCAVLFYGVWCCAVVLLC